MRKPKAISYLRFSTKSQGKADRDSTRRQLSMALTWCKKNNIELNESVKYHDLGISAYRGKNSATGMLRVILDEVKKPGGQIKAGDYLLVEAIDRLSRSAPFESFDLVKEIVGAGLTLVSLVDGQEYSKELLNNDSGKMYILLGAIGGAHNYSKGLSGRILQVQERKRSEMEEGRKTKHMCPSWVQWDIDKREYVLNDLAPLIRMIWLLRTQPRMGKAAICSVVKEQFSFPRTSKTGRCNNWAGFVSHILTCKEVVGERTLYKYNDGVSKATKTIPGYYPAVITQEQYDRARQMMANETFYARGGHRPEINNLFTGLLHCSLCGGKLTLTSSSTPNGTVRYVICKRKRLEKSCSGVSSRLDFLEERILRYLSRELSATDLLADETVSMEMAKALADADLVNRRLQEQETVATTLASRLQDPQLSEAAVCRLVENLNNTESLISKSREELSRLQLKAASLHASLGSTESCISAVRELTVDVTGVEPPDGKSLRQQWAEIVSSPHPAHMPEISVKDRAKLRLSIAAIVDKIVLNEDKSAIISFKTGADRRVELSRFIRSGWGQVALLKVSAITAAHPATELNKEKLSN